MVSVADLFVANLFAGRVRLMGFAPELTGYHRAK